MNTAYLLMHTHSVEDNTEDIKIVGIYSSYQSANDAIQRLADKPGFLECPNLIDSDSPELEDTEDGFYIVEYEIDQDQWPEGFEAEE
jgi:hypothetical protein